MCNASCIIFGATNLTHEQVAGKRILEVGSYDVDGSLRPILQSWNPSHYVGVDIQDGPGVDVICGAENIAAEFGQESFDIVISTELLEHVRDWRTVVSNIKRVCRRNGLLLITTRSYGFPYHAYPSDFWRFECSDMEAIFSDCVIDALERDRVSPGVMLKARKPQDFVERDLAGHELYSIILRKRIHELAEGDVRLFLKRYRRRLFLKNVEKSIRRFLSSAERA